jgi:hypothetical protein
MNEGLLAASHGGRYANAAVLLILGLFVLFMAYAVTERASLPVHTHDPDEVEPEYRVDAPLASDWIEGERRRARVAGALRSVLVVTGVGLLLASGLAAVFTWL